VIALYVATAFAVVLQRGVLGPQHNVFKIFRHSFWHLVAGRNLYAAYPMEQGGAPADLFKYSPTAALLFAPIAVLPYSLALFAWSLLGGLALYRALTLVLEPRRALIASLLVYPDLIAALQSCSSNAQVAALMILAYVALERGSQLRGSVALTVGTAIKIFPLVAATFAVFHPRRGRFLLILLVVAVIGALLPLIFTSPALLIQQYKWWVAIQRSDAADLAFGLSAMSLVRHFGGGSWPNWPLQLIGCGLLLLPLVVRGSARADPEFRLGYLASLLMFAVLFNHQAERQSFVIATAGAAIWCVSPPRGTGAVAPRTALAASAMIGLKTLPLLVVWLVAQAELYGWRLRIPLWRSDSDREREPAAEGVSL
jgi:hypothetical protein